MKTILVIDDLPENVFMLQDRLENEGYNIITAYDGKSGIEKVHTELPDLILLDIMMPGITGIEVCKILVNDESTKHIPIILVTAKAGAEDTKEGLEAGAFDYIKKPFNRVELLARVQSALKLSEANKLLLEAEMKNTFVATVVTANHKIKQPLTLLSLSSAAIKRELGKDEISRESILSRLKYVDTAVKEITDVLNQLNTIKKPELAQYTKNIKMIKVDEEDG
ncbi:MAG: response regulator [Ignavibacteria bacterium]|nr:response regulator [Ignavibacteria bacterium]MBT8383883.1 response regulator [Ignavibacteria bacterium]MBT8390554.1 response regulator [Ignavibacteria bacterium]NNJ51924.1 response regulator [Ignavibacteriaceae bacterium]NNL20414.1 response regulator [Ignavibacteriaceae bacterium]